MNKGVSLIEVSWEVCNKVGGIYTVISSKAPYIRSKLEDYILIGPYLKQNPPKDFIEELVPVEYKEIFSEMKNRGIICRYGTWLIKSQPKVILVDFSDIFNQKDDIKSKLWEKYKIDSLNSGFDFDEPVVFSVAVAQLLDLIEKKTGKKIISQFHEWMTGAALIWVKKLNRNISTIFTTHATVLGRALAGVNSSFYSTLKNIDPEKEARTHNVIAKHQIEKASAVNSDVFTTVSEITGFEAEIILGRKADVILPNGIDLESFKSFEELSIKHSSLKHDVKDFIISYFFPYYSFELDDTLILFTIGRYEFENKGIDVIIDSLGKLNDYMKKQKINKTIIMFFFIPADTGGISNEVLENKTIFYDIKNFINKEKNNILDRIIYSATSQGKLKKINLLDDSSMELLQKKSNYFIKKGIPSYSTHYLKYYESDAIIRGFKKAKLLNLESDKIKVIFYPTYLKSTDGLLNLDVYDVITSGHLGIFPSAYEPWGYTPLESAALGVASITSDLSGFGIYTQKKVKEETPGVFVLKRAGLSKETVENNLLDILKYYVSLNKEERIQHKIEARRLASLADWKNLIIHYFEAYDNAAKK